MNAYALFVSRIKASLRDIASMTILLLCVAAALLANWRQEQKRQGMLTLALVNEDQGGMGTRLESMLFEEESLLIRTMDANAANRLLMQDRAQCVVKIPADFTARLERREFRNTAVLTVSSGSAYAATISEPLVNAIMKLWFERRTIYNVDEFLLGQGLSLTPEQKRNLEIDTQRIWREGALIRVESVATEAPFNADTRTANTAMCWYAAFIPFYLMLNSSWMLRDGCSGLIRRIRQTGFSFPVLFLTHSAAVLVLAMAGFTLIGLSVDARTFLAFMPHMLLYCVGCTGIALILCSLCRNFTALMLIAPTATLSMAALSGLLMPLPDWADVWAALSKALPGRSLYEALTGAPDVHALAIAKAWLLIGLLCARFIWRDSREASGCGV